MKSVLVAALVVQMTTAGGAGARDERADERDAASADDLKKNLAALKHELSEVSEQYRVARERRRQEAERKKRESGEWTNEPAATTSSTTRRGLAPSGGNGTPAR
ncbi:hypothetical protein MYSTI_05132 [Myxococcus stipitatus DSM 14675]|uniref:Uncharacterized protein n=2 Tax=Myxococcus stipitatus TaxID=83455 RepID=L7UJ00_MYXSD|nr:hypothetical protein MYSTI_05132 [Myxococcus stipitatus DSM 14675]